MINLTVEQLLELYDNGRNIEKIKFKDISTKKDVDYDLPLDDCIFPILERIKNERVLEFGITYYDKLYIKLYYDTNLTEAELDAIENEYYHYEE